MNTLILIAAGIMLLALTFYAIAIITEQRTHTLSKRVVGFLSLGLALNLVSSSMLMLEANEGTLSLPRLAGLSSLAGMLIACILLWRLGMTMGWNAKVPKGIHLYLRYIFIWWVITLDTGGLL